MTQRIKLCYWIAARMNKSIDYQKALKIASHFTECQLTRIFEAVSRKAA